jgi:hypothetical protein
MHGHHFVSVIVRSRLDKRLFQLPEIACSRLDKHSIAVTQNPIAIEYNLVE